MKRFVDVTEIEVIAGNGGDGSKSFRREKYIPKGGPDGGNGGNGGSVIFKATSALATLYDYRHKHKLKAEHGEMGRKQQMTGKTGEDLIVEVPQGTIIYEVENPDTPDVHLAQLADLAEDGQEVVIAKGGKGGRGNTTFKSSTNQAPDYADAGTPGEHKLVILELKLVADIGLIGLPNAGKSTLLAHLTEAQPEIANYPFTTLEPNLGVMKHYDDTFVLSDIPGLIEGAAEGKGLGDDFLRHVERTKVLVHIIDPVFADPFESYKTIRKELEAYSPRLLETPELIVINKIDITEVREKQEEYVKLFGEEEVLFISAATGEGLEELQVKMVQMVKDYEALLELEEEKKDEVARKHVTLTIDDLKHY